MSKEYDAVMRAQRERNENHGEGVEQRERDANYGGAVGLRECDANYGGAVGLRERDASHGGGVGLRDLLLGWLPGRRPAEVVAPQPVVDKPRIEEPPVDLEELSSRVDASVALQEKISSIEVTVDALDDRISAEIVEREAKMLEAIGRGIRGLQTELLIRITSTTRETKRSIQTTAAITVGVIVLLAGITIGLLREL